MMEIQSSDSLYSTQIRQFFQSEFPAITSKSTSDVLELITEAILASGKIRLGPRPSIESQFSIRQTIGNLMALNMPIRFLMPWGSEKPVSLQTVDLAEVAALKTLSCLQARVKQVYEPGIHVRVRVEDATAPSLFYDRKEQARLDAHIYTESLKNLVNVFDLTNYIQLVLESTMVTEERFNQELLSISHVMLDYLTWSENPQGDILSSKAFHKLNSLGWTNRIPTEQREHYRGTYRRLYGMDDKAATAMLARYLSQSLARVRLKMLGNLEWEDYLGLSFVGPIPGEEKSRTLKRIYYRTIPENLSSLHMPPWRAKGYLSITDSDRLRVRLASWAEQRQYVYSTTTLKRDGIVAIVSTDYEVL